MGINKREEKNKYTLYHFTAYYIIIFHNTSHNVKWHQTSSWSIFSPKFLKTSDTSDNLILGTTEESGGWTSLLTSTKRYRENEIIKKPNEDIKVYFQSQRSLYSSIMLS